MRRYGMGKKFLISAISVISFFVTTALPFNHAGAATYVTISGQVSNSAGVPLSTPSIALARVSNGEIIGNLDSQGKYSINVPAGTAFELTFVLYEEGSLESSGRSFDVNRINPGFSNWTTKFTSQLEDKVVNFRLPSYLQLNVSVTDAQNALMTNVVLTMPDANQNHNPYTSNGITWTGIQRSSSNQTWYISRTGSFIFQFYATDNFKGFAYWQTTDLNNPSAGSGITYSPSFSILNSKSIQLCLPVNFGSIKSTPASCLDNQIAADKAAADKAAADKAAADKAAADKAAADKAAADKAAADKAAAVKKRTITCLKGKVIKKVTAIKPKCPSGYKLKK
jgi:hypothetical protein